MGRVPCPRVTQLNLYWLLPRPWQDKATRSREGGATGNPEVVSSGSPVRERCQSGSWKSGGMALPPNHTTQSWIPPESTQTSIPWPRQLAPQQGTSPQCKATGSPEDGAIVFPQADAIWRGVFLPTVAVALVFSPESQTSVSPYTTLVCSILLCRSLG